MDHEFGIYKVHDFTQDGIRHLQGNSSRNVLLGDDGMAEVIRMGFIVVRVETRCKMDRICITDVLHVPKL